MEDDEFVMAHSYFGTSLVVLVSLSVEVEKGDFCVYLGIGDLLGR